MLKAQAFLSAQRPLIAVLGPTGSGKSELALHLAEHLGGELVNYDSIQLYRGLNIGSAKTPPESRRGIPHHLIDILAPSEELTAGAYARLARPILQNISNRGSVPILVGGTGFYLKALLNGLSPAPGRDDKLRERLTALARRKPRALHRFLAQRDRTSAARIHPNDHQKLIRAIELTVVAREPASEIQSRPRDALSGFVCLKLGLNPDRTELYTRLNDRAARMFATGLLEEADALLAAGLPPSAKPLGALGYKQAVDLLMGNARREAAVSDCQTRTRQYAKRQMTWLRSETDTHWLNGFGSHPDTERNALELASAFLAAGSRTCQNFENS